MGETAAEQTDGAEDVMTTAEALDALAQRGAALQQRVTDLADEWEARADAAESDARAWRARASELRGQIEEPKTSLVSTALWPGTLGGCTCTGLTNWPNPECPVHITGLIATNTETRRGR